MKIILLVIGFLFTSQSFAAEPEATFCSSEDLNFNGGNNCISTCSAIAENPSSYLGSGQYGFCTGQASYGNLTIYEVALGRENSDGPLCTIWSGSYDMNRANYSPGESTSAGVIDLSSCESGNYDVVFLTSARFGKYSGNTVFPDGSGKKVRTTSVFSSDSSDYSVVDDWLETSTSHSNNSLGYVRPSSGSSTVYNKLSSVPSNTDLTSSSDAVMTFDWAKDLILGYSTDTRSGWYCDGDSYCVKVLDDDSNKILDRMRHNETTILEGLPLTIRDGDTTLDNFNISYYSISDNRNGTDELGWDVLWYNDGGTLKYLGSFPGANGMYITIGSPINAINNL